MLKLLKCSPQFREVTTMTAKLHQCLEKTHDQHQSIGKKQLHGCAAASPTLPLARVFRSEVPLFLPQSTPVFGLCEVDLLAQPRVGDDKASLGKRGQGWPGQRTVSHHVLGPAAAGT